MRPREGPIELYFLTLTKPYFKFLSAFFSDRRNSFDQGQRRRAASLSTPHRASDIQVDPVMSAALFREVRGVSQHILSFIVQRLSRESCVHCLSLLDTRYNIKGDAYIYNIIKSSVRF